MFVSILRNLIEFRWLRKAVDEAPSGEVAEAVDRTEDSGSQSFGQAGPWKNEAAGVTGLSHFQIFSKSFDVCRADKSAEDRMERFGGFDCDTIASNMSFCLFLWNCYFWKVFHFLYFWIYRKSIKNDLGVSQACYPDVEG